MKNTLMLHDKSRQQQLHDWLAGSRARLLVQREHVLVREVLVSLTGYRLLQIGAWGFDRELLSHAATLCQWRLARWPDQSDDVGFDGANLPIASASIDALLLAHSLDLARQPYRLLRECERVLSDRGQLVLLGFNPLSPWALGQRLPGWSRHRFVQPSHFYTAQRVCDWLRLLGFQPERLVRYGTLLPMPRHGAATAVNKPSRRRAAGWMAQAYLVVARKRVAPLTRIRWKDKKAARSASGEIGLANHGAGRLNSRR